MHFLRNYFSYIFKKNFQSNRIIYRQTMDGASGGGGANNDDEIDQRIVWVDLEMTGLDLEKDRIIEMACIVTDKNLKIIAEAPNLIINQPDSILDSMGHWCKEHHGKSGLTEAVRKSELTQTEAEKKMLEFVKRYTPPSRCPLAGNSVHVDKTFLEKYFPNFMNHLHYRIIDVSSIKELCKRWYPNVYSQTPAKAFSHRALDDIRESIEELKAYKNIIFIKEENKAN